MQTTVSSKTDAVIFDLGGVIIDLTVEKTIQQFSLLSGLSPDEVKTLYLTHPAFALLEKGVISEQEFRVEIRGIFNADGIDDDMIDEAWNAMLAGLPKAKLDLMLRLKQRYRVFILSNTNTIHIDYVNRNLIPAACEHTSFEPFVHKAYYSHQVGMRKPDLEIYRHVLDDNDLVAERSLFLDDNADNIQAARKLGISTIHIENPEIVIDLFKE